MNNFDRQTLMLRPFQLRTIDRTTKKGIADLQIEVWDKDLIFDDLVGSAITDAEGYLRF